MKTTQNGLITEFINQISDLDGFIEAEYQWLCICPFTGVKLAPYVKNIGTTQFCSLFQRTMKPTSCERHLRRYKASGLDNRRMEVLRAMVKAKLDK